MSNGNPANYEYIANTYDVEDFYKFIGFENRKNNIEKYLMDNSSSDTPKEKTNTVSFSNPQEAYKYFNENK